MGYCCCSIRRGYLSGTSSGNSHPSHEFPGFWSRTPSSFCKYTFLLSWRVEQENHAWKIAAKTERTKPNQLKCLVFFSGAPFFSESLANHYWRKFVFLGNICGENLKFCLRYAGLIHSNRCKETFWVPWVFKNLISWYFYWWIN